MSDMKTLSPQELLINPFTCFLKDWMLITAQGKDGRVNAMTASWGGLAIMWGQPVAFAVIRPQRFTKKLIDETDTYSLAFFDERYRKTLEYFGKVSGFLEDKIKTSGLAVAMLDDTPYFTEADTVLLCKKLYRQAMTPDGHLDPTIPVQWYPNNDYHTLYIAKVEKALVRQ